MKTIPLDTEQGREIVKALIEIIHNFTTYGMPVETSRAHRIWSESIKQAKIIQHALSDTPEKPLNAQESSQSVTNGGLSGGMSNDITVKEDSKAGLLPVVVNPETSNPVVVKETQNMSDKPSCICGFDAEGWRYMTIGEEILEGDEVEQNKVSEFNFKPVRFSEGLIVRITEAYRTRRPLPGCPACNVPASDISPNRVDKTAKCEHLSGVDRGIKGPSVCARCGLDRIYWADKPECNERESNHAVTDCDRKRKPFSLEGYIDPLREFCKHHETRKTSFAVLNCFDALVAEINRLRESNRR
jgi:hypothetical protein